MKRNITTWLLPFFLIVGCSPSIDESSNTQDSALPLELPAKSSAMDNAAHTSPINSRNLDDYMFREDVQYVDLRNLNMVFKEGYVCGFQFIPFYQIIASFSSDKTLYKMITSEGLTAGQIGSFSNNYIESMDEIKYHFAEDKAIFLISQGGSESSYMINLLIQLGYDGNMLYNVGGVSNNEGVPAYRNIKTNKYFVEAGIVDIDVSFDFTFSEELTPIK